MYKLTGFLSVSLVTLAVLCACGDGGGSDEYDFDSPDGFLANPAISDAIVASGIEINTGDHPPQLEGEYHAEGSVTQTHPDMLTLEGNPIASILCFYNQYSNSIIFNEKLGDVLSKDRIAYVTGSGGKFSIWQEARESGHASGLPEGCTIHSSLIMSGHQDENGDLRAEGLNTFIHVEGCDDDEVMRGQWWHWSATLSFNPECAD